MKEYLKKFIFFIILSIVTAIVFRMALPKTINVRVIGNISTTTDVSGAVDVSGLVDTNTKLMLRR